MKGWVGEVVRKVRGIAGTTLTWGISGGLLGLIPGVLFAVFTPVPTLRILASAVTLFGTAGAVAGAVFSLILSTVYRHHRLEDLRPSRVGLWGMGTAQLLTFGFLRWIASAGADPEPLLYMILLLAAGAFGFGTGALLTRIAQRSGGDLQPSHDPAGLIPGE